MNLQSTFIFLAFVVATVLGGEYTVTHQVYFDITYDKIYLGRIVIGLFGDVVPKTVKNFYTIATEGIYGQTYAGSKIHRLVKTFMMQGGDILNGDGTGSISIYGHSFEDENFIIKHAAPGFVSMANYGKNRNGCQFMIITKPTPWFDGQHVVFGKVVSGFHVIHTIEQSESDPMENTPVKPVVIEACGSVKIRKPFTISDKPYDRSHLYHPDALF